MNPVGDLARPRSLVATVGRSLEAVRLVVLAAGLLGVLWLEDASSADALAPKDLWFAVALGLLPTLTALKLWWDQPLHLPSKGLLLGLAAFCGAATLAYAASPLPEQSHAAWQAWLLLALLLAASVDLFSGAIGRLWLLRVLVLGAGVAGGRSLAQRFHLDTGPVAEASAAAFGGRVAACFGNPNFAGGFFVLVLPVLVHQSVAGTGRVWRLGARLSTLLAFLGLVLCAGKAAFLGLGIATAVAGHLFFWSGAPAALKRRALVRLGGFLALGLLVGSLVLPKASLDRLAGGPGAWSTSVAFRRVTWAGTWDLFRARPLLGWGPGTFSAAYPAYRLPEAMAGQVQHAYEVTAPENWPLQFLAESGVLGLGAALLLLGVLLLPLRRAARAWADDPQGAGLCLALCCAAAACLGCNLASLDLFLPSTLLPFVLLLGLGAALTTSKAAVLSLNPEHYARILVSVALAFMAAVPVTDALLHMQAARLLARARTLSGDGHFAEAVPDYRLALQFDPGLLEARYFLGSSLLDSGGATNLALAQTAFDGLRAYAPDYVQVHAKLGRLCQARGDYTGAAAEYERQLKLDPWDLGTVEALASLCASRGRLDEAETVLTDAARRWPENTDLSANLAAVETALRRQRGGP